MTRSAFDDPVHVGGSWSEDTEWRDVGPMSIEDHVTYRLQHKYLELVSSINVAMIRLLCKPSLREIWCFS
jgi:hypothetical protein